MRRATPLSRDRQMKKPARDGGQRAGSLARCGALSGTPRPDASTGLRCWENLFRRVKLAVEPAEGFGLYRIGLNLRLVNMTAFGAAKGPMLEAGTRRDNTLNR
jgi:hypothetical protein